MTMQLLVALKWSALRTEVDSRSGAAHVLPGQFGSDPAALAALQWALRLAEPIEALVTAVTVGPASTEEGLRHALSLGADRARRIDGPADCAPLDVAAAIAPLAAEADLVVVGARSIDGASAAVAPALAALLDRPQACGLLAVDWADGHLAAERRLPAGRRELIRLALPAVISVESGSTPLGRAALPDLLAAAEADIDVSSPDGTLRRASAGTVAPYRPRPRIVPLPPAGEEPRERIEALLGGVEGGSHAQQVQLPPNEAAAEIVATLRRWGYLGED